MSRRWLLVAVCSVALTAGCDDDADMVADAGRGGAGGASAGGAGGGSAGAGGTGGTAAGGAGGAVGSGGSSGADGGGSDADARDGSSADGGDAGDVAAAETAGDSAGDTGSSASAMVTAAAGGTVESGGGKLLVPAGTLATDKMLTLSVRPAVASDPGRANLASAIYDFGPDGTVFASPVPLTIEMNDDVPAGKRAVVAWLDTGSGQWFPVPSTMEDASHVRGLVTHFTSFAVVLLDEDAACPSAPGCGGSLAGTWRYAATCLKVETGDAVKCGENAELETSIDYALEGTVTIEGTRYTATQMIALRRTLFYTPACLEEFSMGQPIGPCSNITTELNKLGNQGGTWACSGSPAQGCSCQLTINLTQSPMGSVAVNGQQVTFTEDGEDPDQPAAFCVKGNTLTVQEMDGTVYTATRQ